MFFSITLVYGNARLVLQATKQTNPRPNAAIRREAENCWTASNVRRRRVEESSEEASASARHSSPARSLYATKSRPQVRGLRSTIERPSSRARRGGASRAGTASLRARFSGRIDRTAIRLPQCRRASRTRSTPFRTIGSRALTSVRGARVPLLPPNAGTLTHTTMASAMASAVPLAGRASIPARRAGSRSAPARRASVRARAQLHDPARLARLVQRVQARDQRFLAHDGFEFIQRERRDALQELAVQVVQGLVHLRVEAAQGGGKLLRDGEEEREGQDARVRGEGDARGRGHLSPRRPPRGRMAVADAGCGAERGVATHLERLRLEGLLQRIFVRASKLAHALALEELHRGRAAWSARRARVVARVTFKTTVCLKRPTP